MPAHRSPSEPALVDQFLLAAASVIYVCGVLLVLSSATATTEAARPAADTLVTVVSARPAVAPSADVPQTLAMHRHQITLEVPAGGGVEFKYRIEKGGGMVYAWSASTPVAFEFHGELSGALAGSEATYRTGEDRAGRGVFIAQASGIHGWYWGNSGPTPTTITLDASGFFTGAVEFRDSGRIEHAIGR
jgi:hypothetical protein